MDNLREKTSLDLKKICSPKVYIAGDIILDSYIYGKCDRISPEAPVPVIKFQGKDYRLGGAGNVAENIKSGGGEPIIYGMLGKDDHGKIAKDLLDRAGIRHRLIESKKQMTTTKVRLIADSQQVARIDYEETEDYSEQVTELFPKEKFADLILISDYGKGVVGKKLLSFLLEKKIKTIVDPKLNNREIYQNSYLMTPNRKEALELTGKDEKGAGDISAVASAMLSRYNLKNVLITLGQDGMILKNKESEFSIPTAAKKVFDVTGAGDTVIAYLTMGLIAGLDMESAAAIANSAAGLVVSKQGTYAPTKKEVLSYIHNE